jgi:hypothetical protein
MNGQNDVRVRVQVDDDTRQGLNSAEQNTGGFVDKLKGGLESLGPAAAVAGGAIAAGLAVAAAAAVVLKKALDASIERSNIGNTIAAQLGDTEHAAELGGVLGVASRPGVRRQLRRLPRGGRHRGP